MKTLLFPTRRSRGEPQAKAEFFQITPTFYQEFVHALGDDPATIMVYDFDGHVIALDSISVRVTVPGEAIAIESQTAIAYHLILRI
jgi:hypothetical protein